VDYEFAPSHVQVVAALIDRVADAGDDPMKVWERLWLDEEYKHLNEELRVEVDFIFAYELQEKFESAGEVELVESRLSSTATRPMSGTPASAWTLWSEVSSTLENPGICAHLADVLLTARVKTTPEHAASTIGLYLKAVEFGDFSAHQAALSLGRANNIARSRGMADEGPVRVAMHRWSETFGNDIATIGPALSLLAALSVPPRDGVFAAGERESVRSQLFALGDSPMSLVDELAKTIARLAENATELEISRRWHVKQYLAFADSAERGMVKMQYAQTAADLAKSYGLPELKDAAVLIMQTVDHDSMGWKTAGFNLPMPRNFFRAHLRRYRRARNWEHGLMVFLAGSSPAGDHEANVRTAERAASGSIRALVTRTVYGSHGLPERTNADFLMEEIVRTETIALNISSILLALELAHIRDRFSPPRADRIANWMVDSFSADPRLAKHFEEVVALHWAGKFSDSARLSIPLIERAARELLLRLDEPLYRTQRGESPGRFPAMDFYVDALAKRDLDPDWDRALRVTLLSPGMNLRNLSAHGFTLSFSEYQSALLLRLAGLFCAMPIGMDQSGLQSPPTVARRQLRRRLGWVWS
jgi:hypothetical protein